MRVEYSFIALIALFQFSVIDLCDNAYDVWALCEKLRLNKNCQWKQHVLVLCVLICVFLAV